MKGIVSFVNGIVWICLVAAAVSFVPPMVNAQSIGTCRAPASSKFLDINNVRAAIENNGSLFKDGLYEVPSESRLRAIYAARFLISGTVDGEIAGSLGRYNNQKALWAGPVFPGLKPPPDCDDFDYIYKINREDLVTFETDGTATSDLLNWPTGLGAPTLDADGNRIVLQSDGVLAHIDASGVVVFEENISFDERLGRTIDLAGGERPNILGDQMLWWIMNDLGNVRDINTRAIGIEVHGTAFAFNVPGAIGNTTFYKFRVINKSNRSLDQAYIGMFFDSDLGFSGDDYVGVDTTLGLGYTYNADNHDEAGSATPGYGAAPPAVGVDFFQGPVADEDGLDNDRDGIVDEADERLQMTAFVRAIRGGGPFEGDPASAVEYYNIMQGMWKDGLPMTIGGNGRDFSTERTSFQFSGAAERGEYWSENNTDTEGTSTEPSDRRFFVSSGPITMGAGDDQEIVFGIVWSQGTDYLDSVRRLKIDDQVAQAAFDLNFELTAVPSAPHVTATTFDGQVLLEWSNRPADNNYLDGYREKDVLSEGTYVLEGYTIYEFESPQDQEGKVLATYDVANGVTRIIEGLPGELNAITADGKDSGVQHSHLIDGLTNYRTYFFGVRAYAYNKAGNPKIYQSPVTRIEVVPSRIDARDSGTALQTEFDVDIVASVVAGGVTDGRAGARIVNPASVTGHEYFIVFGEDTLATGANVVTYDIIDTETGENKYDGREALRQIESRQHIDDPGQWVTFSQHDNIVIIDGLEFSINSPKPGIRGFETVANSAGPIQPPDMAAFAFNGSGFPQVDGKDRPSGGQQSNGSTWGFHTGGQNYFGYGDEEGPFNQGNTFIGRSVREGWDPIGGDNYEWRFTQHCLDAMDGIIAVGDCLADRRFEGGALVEIPFEVWNTGPSDDPGDDYQMLPSICESACNAGTLDFKFDLGEDDHSISSNDDDPYTDLIYMYKPEDNGKTPGNQGYLDHFFGSAGSGERTFSRLVLVNWNGGSERPYDAELPEPGTIFRIVTRKPNAPGLILGIDTAGREVMKGVETVALSALEQIGIVPNPYKGASTYEVSQRADEVRFTNMPPQATISIFDLAGSLIRRLEKNSPEPFFPWNLRTDEDLPIASGIYFILVDVPGVGERAFKFAVVRKGTRIRTF